MKKRILSGIQPTGELHFGNYFGAVQNWLRLQEEHECMFAVVDYHAITMPYDPQKLRENTWSLALNLLALGLRAETLFIQSLVPEHTELAWILNGVCPYGELSRMTQFKDKSEQLGEDDKTSFVSAGLFTYPVLQAADILVYQAHYVPVGKDQEQHLELTRNIAQRFNNRIGKEFFHLPEALYTEVPKVMSLADPTRKMSKSLGDKHYIAVFEEPARLTKKVKSAVTDTGEGTGAEMSAGVANLFRLLRAAGDEAAYAELMAQYEAGSRRYADLKEATAAAISRLSSQFIERRTEIQADKKRYKELIQDSSAAIRKKAQETLRQAKDLCGLLNVR